jgi:hypothetical protein
MKIRWTHQSLRLRITPPELEALRRGESVQETSGFPGGWSVTLECRAAPGLFPGETPGSVAVALSPVQLMELARPDAEGVYLGADAYRYYIEKDFPCLHPRAIEATEPATETFLAPPNFAQKKLG